MNPSTFTQLGVAGVICLLQSIAIVALWKDNQSLRKQGREDQAVILPALTAATDAIREFSRVAAVLLSRDRRER